MLAKARRGAAQPRIPTVDRNVTRGPIHHTGRSHVVHLLLVLIIGHGRVYVDSLADVVSGFDPANITGSDPAVLLSALGRTATDDEIGSIAPWRFKAPMSPDLAARDEGRSIDLKELVAFSRGAADRRGRHDGLPNGVDPADNELGWRMSVDKLAALVERAPD